ncbi:MAG TPA: SRPBCC family protein [Pseudolabrys sp.]|nr:SRPBCC family protein [Pseudolabrys sp.]
MGVKNNVDLDTDPRSIIGSRLFDAPRELVFAAFTDPKHLAQWWGPNGFTTTTHSFEFRPGGIWRFVMHGPDGRDYQNRVVYEEILRPERIVFRHDGGEDESVEPVRFTQTLTFEDIGGRRTRLTWHGRFPTAEARARVIRDYGADKGLSQTMDRLAGYVATTATARTA